MTVSIEVGLLKSERRGDIDVYEVDGRSTIRYRWTVDQCHDQKAKALILDLSNFSKFKFLFKFYALIV